MKKSALIIGGGIAGLAAARELAGKGMTVILLEAKERCGGRMHTIRARDYPIELGAEFVHGSDPSLLKVLKEARLTTLDVPERTLLFANGKFSEVDVWKTVADAFHKNEVPSSDCSCEEFFAKTVAEPNRTLLRHFVEGFHAADASRMSAQALRDWEQTAEDVGEAHSLRVATGYGSVVDFYEREIEKCGGQILKNITVRKITWREGSVEVWAQELVAGQPPTSPPEFLSVPRPVIPETEGFRKFAAEAVIVALPLAVLQANEVQFEPPLPAKLQAVSHMAVGNVAKITFTFKQPVWDDFGYILAPDEAIPTWWSDSRRLSITGWAGGPKADALVKLLPEELEHLGLGILYKILSRHAADLRQNFVVSHYWNWAVDPHIRGAYCYIPVGGSDLPRQLAEPVAGTLFFAGEAMAIETQTGTVFGALKTGLRAAQELVSA